MEDYARSLEEIEVKEDRSDELKVLRKYVGKLNCLAGNTRPDIAIYTLDLAKNKERQ